ncbi:hypothetical protein BH10PSE17_BH10PSE17_24980 [soil metagenome]
MSESEFEDDLQEAMSVAADMGWPADSFEVKPVRHGHAIAGVSIGRRYGSHAEAFEYDFDGIAVPGGWVAVFLDHLALGKYGPKPLR